MSRFDRRFDFLAPRCWRDIEACDLRSMPSHRVRAMDNTRLAHQPLAEGAVVAAVPASVHGTRLSALSAMGNDIGVITVDGVRWLSGEHDDLHPDGRLVDMEDVAVVPLPMQRAAREYVSRFVARRVAVEVAA